jgi:hypothetical protein
LSESDTNLNQHFFRTFFQNLSRINLLSPQQHNHFVMNALLSQHLIKFSTLQNFRLFYTLLTYLFLYSLFLLQKHSPWYSPHHLRYSSSLNSVSLLLLLILPLVFLFYFLCLSHIIFPSRLFRTFLFSLVPKSLHTQHAVLLDIALRNCHSVI